ncbi:hypothetical protein [Streptomyces erythrochromogenes]
MVIRIGDPYDVGEVPWCVMETDGERYLMPRTALTRQERRPAERTPPARTPGQLLARWRARHGRSHRRT